MNSSNNPSSGKRQEGLGLEVIDGGLGTGGHFRAAMPEKKPRPPEPRPRRGIRVAATPFHELVDFGIEALVEHRHLLIYVHQDRLRQIVDGKPRDVTTSHLAYLLASVVDYTKYTEKKGDTPVVPPREVCSAITERGAWPGVPRLRAVSTIPYLKPNGDIVAEGYDAESQIYVQLDPALAGFPADLDDALLVTPELDADGQNLQRQYAARHAAERLLDHVAGLVWAGNRDRSAWLALLLTLAGRSALDLVPLFAVSAAEPSCGKTPAINIAHGLVYGLTPTAQASGKGEESEKSIARWVGRPLCFFDNQPNGVPFGNATIDRLISNRRNAGRLLATNLDISADQVLTTLAVTGNQLTFAGDTGVRAILMTLAGKPKSFDFQSTDERYYEGHRRGALCDALNILCGYIRAGKPQSTPPRHEVASKFTDWSRLVRGAIMWIGLADPCSDVEDESRSKLRNDIVSLGEFLQMLKGDWRAKFQPSELLDASEPGRVRDAEIRHQRAIIDGEREAAAKELERLRSLYNGRRQLLACLAPRRPSSWRETGGEIGYALLTMCDVWVDTGKRTVCLRRIKEVGKPAMYHLEGKLNTQETTTTEVSSTSGTETEG